MHTTRTQHCKFERVHTGEVSPIAKTNEQSNLTHKYTAATAESPENPMCTLDDVRVLSVAPSGTPDSQETIVSPTQVCTIKPFKILFATSFHTPTQPQEVHPPVAFTFAQQDPATPSSESQVQSPPSARSISSSESQDLLFGYRVRANACIRLLHTRPHTRV